MVMLRVVILTLPICTDMQLTQGCTHYLEETQQRETASVEAVHSGM